MAVLRHAILIAAVSFGEALSAQSLMLGVRGGSSLARLRDQFGPSSSFVGVTAGASVGLELATWVSLHGDLLYTQKGWGRGESFVALDNVEVPVLLRLAVPLTDIDAGRDPGLQPFVAAGGAAARLLHCSPRIIVDNPNGIFDRPAPPDQRFGNCSSYEYPNPEYSLVYGGGVTLRRTRQHLTVEIRRIRGITDLRARRAVKNPDDSGRVTNEMITILVGASLTVK